MDELRSTCLVCGHEQEARGLNPVQVEHVMEVWARLHAHPADERGAWYRSMEEEDAD